MKRFNRMDTYQTMVYVKKHYITYTSAAPEKVLLRVRKKGSQPN